MGLFDSIKPKKETAKVRKLDKNIEGVVNDLKKNRADKCQSMGMSALQIGQDLRYIEKKANDLYAAAIAEIKLGSNTVQAYQSLLDNHAASEADRLIVERMFSGK